VRRYITEYQRFTKRRGKDERMKMFLNLSRTSRVMLMWVIAVNVAMLGIGLLAIALVYPFENSLSFVAGILLGCVHSAAKVVLLEKSIGRTIGMEKEGAENTGRLHYIGRYFLTAAVFVIVVLSKGFFGLFGTIAGVLSLQIAAYITGGLMKNKRV